GTPSSECWRSSGVLVRSSNRLITAWVVARLPAVISVTIRSPGTDQWNILRNTEMLSTPELVRVSLISTSPRSITMPTQYVISIGVQFGEHGADALGRIGKTNVGTAHGYGPVALARPAA